MQVKFLDLTLPQYWLPRYDWVLSLEVLEHIPSDFETTVLDNIDRAAGHGVVLSWAVPGQGVDFLAEFFFNESGWTKNMADIRISLILLLISIFD